MLPFPVTADGAFWNFYWWGRRPGVRSYAPAVGGLDLVERQLAVAGCDWNGLPVAARALAAMRGRLQVQHEDLADMAAAALRHRLRRDPMDETGSSARIERAMRQQQAASA